MRVFALLLAFFAASSPASAADPWTPDWKMIAGDGSVLPSDCIGSTETFDCFIDTLAACSAWSEGSRWRADDTYQEAPICAAVPSFKGLAVLHSLGPTSTQLYLYSVDPWPLQHREDWLLSEGSWSLTKQGDLVVDFFALTCSPNPGCLETIAPGAPNAEILAACPRTACFGGPEVTMQRDTRRPDEGSVPMVVPYISLLVRQTDLGWAVIDWYGLFKYGTRGVIWYPDHWKRK